MAQDPLTGSQSSPSTSVSEQTRPLSDLSRRHFVQSLGGAAAVASTTGLGMAWAGEAPAKPKASAKPAPESLVAQLFKTLDDKQRKQICFDWDYEKEKVPYRLHVRNNWHITQPKLNSGFFTKDQQDMIEAIFWGMYEPEWHDRIRKQLRDDAGGYGKQQSIAIFGKPGGDDKFEFVMTGRHLTIRCDGNSTEHVAFGGPIFYGHAAQGFTEKPDHPGNVFWPQALKANKLYEMLDGKQRKQALVLNGPGEEEVHHQGKDGKFHGLAVSEMTKDQQAHMADVLATLVEPYRQTDRDEVSKCLNANGGLAACRISFFEADDVGEDGVWDNWRLEGPAFVWHFRGNPHVHVWVNVADSPDVKISTS